MEIPTKDYSMSDADLMFRVGDVVIAMERNETEFIARGVTALDRQAFEDEGNAFEIFPSDSYFEADVKQATQEKNIHKAETMRLVQKVSGYVQQEWGIESPQYSKLGIKGIHQVKERVFISLARQTAFTAEGYLATLSLIGLTQADIDALNAEAQLMEDKLHAVAGAESLRKEKMVERIELANALYEKLVKYCEIGKLIWENVNAAKYDDYIIYKTITHGLPKVQGLSVVMGGGTGNDANLNWNFVEGATFYEIYGSTVPLGAPESTFSKIDTVTGTNYLGFVMNGQQTYFKVRARNPLMVGYFSDVMLGEGPL